VSEVGLSPKTDLQGSQDGGLSRSIPPVDEVHMPEPPTAGRGGEWESVPNAGRGGEWESLTIR